MSEHGRLTGMPANETWQARAASLASHMPILAWEGRACQPWRLSRGDLLLTHASGMLMAQWRSAGTMLGLAHNPGAGTSMLRWERKGTNGTVRIRQQIPKPPRMPHDRRASHKQATCPKIRIRQEGAKDT